MLNNTSTSIVLNNIRMLYSSLPEPDVIQMDLKNIEEITFRKHEIILLEQFGDNLTLTVDLTSLKNAVNTISVEWYCNLLRDGAIKESCIDDSELKDVITKVEKSIVERIKFHQNIISILSARTAHIIW